MDLSPKWEFVADTVMGGVSVGRLETVKIEGRAATRLTGDVSLENNGGFVQMAFDLDAGTDVFDASDWSGIRMTVFGNDEPYDLRLRTDQLTRPWQSFRVAFQAPQRWTEIAIPFAAFGAHRTEAEFDPSRLRRIGILAIGRAFQADIAVSEIGFYRDDP